jgi:hypothetical protein
MDKLDPTFNDPTDTMIWADIGGKLLRFERTYQPSKTIGQAIELLEGLEWEAGTHGGKSPYYCIVANNGNISDWHAADAHTFPEAICKAWISYKPLVNKVYQAKKLFVKISIQI